MAYPRKYLKLLQLEKRYLEATDSINKLASEKAINLEQKEKLIAYCTDLYHVAKIKTMMNNNFIQIRDMFEDTFNSIEKQLININNQSLKEAYLE